jgi:multiple sugar transport system substrate-binding protein
MQRKLTLIATVAVIASAALGLVGCQSSQGDSAKTLSVWLPPFAAHDAKTSDLELWNSIVKPFEQENKVDVKITIVPWESFEARFLTGFSSGDGPDLGYMYAEMIGDYISRGQLASFEPYLDSTETKKFYFLDQGMYEGEQYGLPIVVGGARVVYYNKKVLAQAGVTEAPATWDDLVTDAKKVKEAGSTPLLMAWGEPGTANLAQNYINFLWQAGGDILSADGSSAAFNSTAGLKAAEYIQNLSKAGLLAANTTALTNNDLRTKFAAGDVGFAFGDDTDAATYTDAGIDTGAVVLTDKARYTFVASDVLVMSKTTKNKQLASKLALFMLSGPSMDTFHTIAAYPPISSEETGEVNPLFKDFYTTDRDILRQYPAVPNSSTVYSSLNENLQQMLLGQKSPRQALDDAEKAANEALAQNSK